MRVCGQEFSAELLDRIRARVHEQPALSRRALSREVCAWLDWRDSCGRPREVGCRKALARLHAQGVLQLPQSTASWSFRMRKAHDPDVPDPPQIEAELDALGHVTLIPIRSRHSPESRLWKTWLRRHHYLGDGPLCGAQIRYLIRSERYGPVGAMSFSAAAWSVGPRDETIGWTMAARRRNLPLVVCNSRFLIPPTVQVKNLASHALGLAGERLADDWRERYGYEPLLVETYVDVSRYAGTCYRAANWVLAGQTQGRGRQDRGHKEPATIKDVFLHPLCDDWREKLCVEPPRRKSSATKTPMVDWAEEEFGTAEFGDERLRKRLCIIARDFFAHPEASIPDACGSLAKSKAAYRFMTHERVSLDAVLRPHVEQTIGRVAAERLIFAVQDTSTLNYSAHPETGGLGPINTRADGAIGLHLHCLMAYTESGTPKGLLGVQCWAREPESWGSTKGRKETPLEEKESYKWMKGYAQAELAQARCPDTRILAMGDRESDMYELFAEAQAKPQGPGLVIRAERSRKRQAELGPLWEVVPNAPVAGEREIRIPRRGARKARVARLVVRFARVVLQPPKDKGELGAVPITAVYALERDTPLGTEPVEWMVLTTEPVTGLEEAVRVLQRYTQRWNIEVFHRTLKSGCRIENRQLKDADGLEACLGIDLVVAWRIQLMTKASRETPDSPCTEVLEDAEWKALVGCVTGNPLPPARPPTTRQAVRMIAGIGGFLGRKGDGEPGATTIWRGLNKLSVMTWAWSTLYPYVDPARVPVSSNPGYG